MEFFGFERMIFGVDYEKALLDFGAQTNSTSGIGPKASDTQDASPTPGMPKVSGTPGFKDQISSSVTVEGESQKEGEEILPPPSPLMTLAEAAKLNKEYLQALYRIVRGEDLSEKAGDQTKLVDKITAEAREKIVKLDKAIRDIEAKQQRLGSQSNLNLFGKDKTRSEDLQRQKESLVEQKNQLQAALARFEASSKRVLASQASAFAGSDTGAHTAQKEIGSAYKVLEQRILAAFDNIEIPKDLKKAGDLGKFLKDKVDELIKHQQKEVAQFKKTGDVAALKQAATKLKQMTVNKEKLDFQLKLLQKFDEAQTNPQLRQLLMAPVFQGKSIFDLVKEGKYEVAAAFMAAFDKSHGKALYGIKDADVPQPSGTGGSPSGAEDAESAPQSAGGGFGAQSAGGDMGSQAVSGDDGDFLLDEVGEASVAGDEFGTLTSGEAPVGSFGAASVQSGSDFSMTSATPTQAELGDMIAAQSVGFEVASAASDAQARMYKTDKTLKKLMEAIRSGNTSLISLALIVLGNRNKEVLAKVGYLAVKVMTYSSVQKENLGQTVQALQIDDPSYAAKLQGMSLKMNKLTSLDTSVGEVLRVVRTAFDENLNFTGSYLNRESQTAISLAQWR